MTDATTAWLERIGIRDRPALTVAGLDRLVGHHLRSIPFENLAVLRGAIPALDHGSQQRKLVEARRGGYCFELNLLLSHHLRRLGFTVTPRLARVMWQRPAPGPRSHLLLLVEAEGAEWLVDVGFGGPGPDVAVSPGARRTGPVELAQEPGFGTVVSRIMPDGRVEALYAYTEDHVGPSDIDAANRLAAMSPGSIFRARAMAALGDSTARVTLDGLTFTRTAGGQRVEETTLSSAGQVADRLATAFGIEITDADRRALGRTLEGAV